MSDALIPADVIPPGDLPPLRERDLPPPVPLRQMIGPSIILAGLALGSGEFMLWPYITFKSQFVFFWACLLAVVMQYFLNLEIMRWTLATGESAMTGIIRLIAAFGRAVSRAEHRALDAARLGHRRGAARAAG